MPGPMPLFPPGVMEQMALQNPDLVAQQMAAKGIPPPQQLPGPMPPGMGQQMTGPMPQGMPQGMPPGGAPQQGGFDPAMMGLALSGVQATQNQQQQPQMMSPVAPQGANIPGGGLEALLQMIAQGQQRPPQASLGQLIAGG